MFFRYDETKYRDNVTTEEIIKWCDENLTDGEVVVGNIAIFLASETDAMAFKLRWL